MHSSFLNQFGNHLLGLTCALLSWHYLRALWLEGWEWAYSRFALAGFILFGAIAIRLEYAAITRGLAPEEATYHPELDSLRWLIHLITGLCVLGAGYLHRAELMEINHKTEAAVFAAILFLALVVSI